MTQETTRRGTLAAGLAIGAAALLAGCGGASFATRYDAPLLAEVSRGWRLAEVKVDVPATLDVSEARTLFPRADIVWREDPPGDRRAQVAAIFATAVGQGAAGLRGSRPVTIALTVTRFHALTFEAETRLRRSGVHDVEFIASVLDATTGELLAGPAAIEASLPALSGPAMAEARSRGESQKSQITSHVAATIAGWLGTGPDPRRTFNRLGG